jgi:transcription antitermination factor NusG
MASGQDHRDSRNWVVLELTRMGELKAEEGCLQDLLRKAMGLEDSHPVFVPSVTYMNFGQKVTLHLMEGYAFVRAGVAESSFYALEGSCPYVKRVLSSRGPTGFRALSVIPDSNVRDMRKQLSEHISEDIREGMAVTVTDGVYSSLNGEVVEVAGDEAHVRFVLRSLDLITRVPKVFLTPETEEKKL